MILHLATSLLLFSIEAAPIINRVTANESNSAVKLFRTCLSDTGVIDRVTGVKCKVNMDDTPCEKTLCQKFFPNRSIGVIKLVSS